MHELGNSSDELRKVSDIRRLSKVVMFRDDDSYQSAAESYELYEKHLPEERGKTQFLTREEAQLVRFDATQRAFLRGISLTKSLRDTMLWRNLAP